MITVNGIPVRPTIFPDNTSQVWNLPLNEYTDEVYVMWSYESEAELIHLNMLLVLLVNSGKLIRQLYIPYLPYARQDKEISNDTTWAKKIFLQMLFHTLAPVIETLDEHSNEYGSPIKSLSPEKYIREIDYGSNIQDDRFVLVYPDKGAYNRYYNVLSDYDNYIVMDKIRNQSTGEIEGLSINYEMSKFESDTDNTYLIIDDICDGGRTFIEVAKKIKYDINANNIWLYVSHGIFSKGLDPIYESGISKIFTTNSLHYFRMKRPFDFSSINILGL